MMIKQVEAEAVGLVGGVEGGGDVTLAAFEGPLVSLTDGGNMASGM